MADDTLPGAALSSAQIDDAISLAGLTTAPQMRERLDELKPICEVQSARVEAAARELEKQQEAVQTAAAILKREQGTLAHLTAGASKIEGRIAELKEQRRRDREAKARAEREAERNQVVKASKPCG